MYAVKTQRVTVNVMLDTHQVLLDSLRSRQADLRSLAEEVNGEWVHEDLIYRFYHYSFKVYILQSATERIVEMLRELAPPATSFHPAFLEIVAAGTGKKFELSHNKDWTKHTRPIVEAFLHARFMLNLAAKYSQELDQAPSLLPSGWAALLELYQIR
jgi:hypothetical protein